MTDKLPPARSASALVSLILALSCGGGSYLGAATIYASPYGKSPAGLPYHGGLDAKTAGFLQEIAWETVKECLGK